MAVDSRSSSRSLLQHGQDSRGSYQLVPNSIATSQSCESRDAEDLPIGPLLTGKPLSKKRQRQHTLNLAKASESNWQVWARQMLENQYSQYVTVSIIMLNAVCFGMETDMPEVFCWDIVETFFLIFFACELFLRLFAFRMHFFNCAENNDFTWNIIDFFIVFMGLTATLIVILSPGRVGLAKDATLFRTVRLLRILRILRVVRVLRFLKQLYLLAYGFIEGASAVFWVATLACFANFVCAVVLVQIYRDTDNAFLQDRLSNIPSTMFTLFEILSSPDVDKFRKECYDYPFLISFIVFYIVFGSFGINGLLTGVISESVLEQNQARLDSQRLQREVKRRVLTKDAEELFEQMSEEDKGHVSPQDILEYEDEIRDLFKIAEISIPDYDVTRMIEVMDWDGNGTIDKTEFVNGILQICEDIRPVSIMELHCEIHRCQFAITKCSSDVESIMADLQVLVSDLGHHTSEVARASVVLKDLSSTVAGEGAQSDEHEQESHRSVHSDTCRVKNAMDDVNENPMIDEPKVSPIDEHSAPQWAPLNGDGLKMDGGQVMYPASTTAAVSHGPRDCSDAAQIWHLHLLKAYKDGAEELLRKISEMKLSCTFPDLGSEAYGGEIAKPIGVQNIEVDTLFAPRSSVQDMAPQDSVDDNVTQRPPAHPEPSPLAQDTGSQAASNGVAGSRQLESEVPDRPVYTRSETQLPAAHGVLGFKASSSSCDLK